MNIFQKLTLKIIMKNKKRSIATVIGVVLSTMLVFGVVTFVESVQDFVIRNEIYNEGAWHGCARNSNYVIYRHLKGSEEISQIEYGQQLGYAEIDKGNNMYKPYIYIYGTSTGMADMLPIHITEGNYPASKDEIMLPEHLVENEVAKYKIGDIITLDVGQRVGKRSVLNQDFSCYIYDENGVKTFREEKLKNKETHKYKVVGFYKRPSFEEANSPGYTAITLADEETDSTYDVYFKMKEHRETYEFIKMNNLDGDTNSNLLLYMGESKFDNVNFMLKCLATILIVIIMIGSVALIYNSFGISIAERTKQFGLLASLGATKKQIKIMVLYEAFVIGLVGIIVGILCGILTMNVVIRFLSEKISSVGYAENIHMCISLDVIVIVVIIVFATIYVSVLLPSRKATGVTAMEAIRQNECIVDCKRKFLKNETGKCVKLPIIIANKNFRRNKKQYKTTIFSLVMSIVLFISATSLTEYLEAFINRNSYTEDYDLNFSCKESDFSEISKEELLDLICNNNDIEQCTYYKEAKNRIVNLYIREEHLESEFLNTVQAYQYMDDKFVKINTRLVFLRDAEFEKLLMSNGLEHDIYMDSKNPIALMVHNNYDYNEETETFERKNVVKADKIELKAEINSSDMMDSMVLLAKIIDEKPYYIMDPKLFMKYQNQQIISIS